MVLKVTIAMMICDFEVIYSFGLLGVEMVLNPPANRQLSTLFEEAFLVENSDRVDEEKNGL